MKEERINQIYMLMIAGWSDKRLLQFIADSSSGVDPNNPDRESIWGIRSERTRFWYMAQARERILQVAAQVRERAFPEMLSRHREMRAYLWSLGKMDEVLKIDQEDAKLMGLYSPTKNLNLQVDFDDFTNEQLERIVNGADIAEIIREVEEAKRAAANHSAS